MNRYLFYILPGMLLCSIIAAAQGLKIMPGTTFKLTGGSLDIVLSGSTNLENNAALQNSALVVKATGSGTSQIKGSGALSVGQIIMNKNAGQSLTLMKTINVTSNVTFNTGLLDLNGNNLLLADTALLLNESEVSRVIGPLGGSVQITRNLNAPLAENPGNLGLIITSGSNWGNTTVKRGHNIFSNPGGGSSIARNYTVQATNNTGLNAFLRMYYKDAEINGLNESQFDFFHSVNNGAQWTNIGSVSRDITQNFVNINGVQSLSLLTLSNTNNPLPLLLTDIKAGCDLNRASLQWKTTSPQTTDFFRIMKSNDGAAWEAAADRLEVWPLADHLYTFTDSKSPYSFYRIESVNKDGAIAYSSILTLNCSEEILSFNLMQNPIQNVLNIGVVSKRSRDADLQVFDAQGRLILTQMLKIAPGETSIAVDAGGLANGIYNLRISSNQELLWRVKFVKQ